MLGGTKLNAETSTVFWKALEGMTTMGSTEVYRFKSNARGDAF